MTESGRTPARIVSLTPLAIEKDSRTFKQAASMTRLGYESIVVEGVESHLERSRLPFELRTVGSETRAERTDAVGAPRRLARVLAGHSRTLVWRYARPLYRVWMFFWHVGPATARSLPQASLFYLHSPNQALAICLRAPGTPFIYDAHDFYPGSRKIGGERSWSDDVIDRLLLAIERACVRRAAALITVGDGVSDEIEREFGRRPIVVRNCHDTRIDTRPNDDLRSCAGVADGDFVVCTVGNEKEGAATSQAIQAMALLPEHVHLALVGSGYGRYRSEIEAAGVSGRVHLLAPVAPTEVVPFMKSADAAAVLYEALTVDYRHSLPNRFFSAVAAGLPLLYPEQLPELAGIANEHDLGVAIDPRDPRSIAAGIRLLLDDPNRLRRHREAAVRAQRVVSWESEEAQLGAAVERSLAAAAGA